MRGGLYQDDPLQPADVGAEAAAAAPVALALVDAGRWSLSIHQHPAPATAVVAALTTSMISSAPRPRCEAPGGEGVAGDVLPGAAAPAPEVSTPPVPAVAAAVTTIR